MDIRSIWCDTYYEQGVVENYLDYSIVMVDNDIEQEIYKGRAYRLPNEDYVKININKICQNYLDSEFVDGMESFVSEDGDSFTLDRSVMTFRFYVNDTLQQTYLFINDWSHERRTLNDSNTNHDCNSIINGHYSPKMFLFSSMYDRNTQKIVVKSEGYNYRHPACGDYALYYQNVHGGWNSFLIEGTVMKKENYTNHGYSKTFNNTRLNFEERTYASEASTAYSCVTGWLSDDESERFVKNIGNATSLFLHDLKKDEIKPVLITDNNLVYKTYQNQGKKLVNYTFNLKESQTKIRL